MEKLNSAIFEMHHLSAKQIPVVHYDVYRTAYGPDKKNWHNNFEILYFTGDNTTIFYDDNYYEVKNGDIFIISPNKPHQVFPGKTSVTYHVFLIDNDFCKYNDIHVDKLIYQTIVRSDTAQMLAKQLIKELESHDKFLHARIKSSLLQFILYLSMNYTTPSSEQNKISHQLHESLGIAINYINTHIFENLTLESVAKEAGISKCYFSREFKKHIGLPFVSYINKLRCKKAAELLLTGNYSVRQISLMCGFSADCYFSNIFKKQFGITPSEYAKSQQKSN